MSTVLERLEMCMQVLMASHLLDAFTDGESTAKIAGHDYFPFVPADVEHTDSQAPFRAIDSSTPS
jgi:hypothetical protein